MNRNGEKKSLYCRVDFPVDSLCSDYIQSEKQRKHNNYLKIRKTAKRGRKIPIVGIFRWIWLLNFSVSCLVSRRGLYTMVFWGIVFHYVAQARIWSSCKEYDRLYAEKYDTKYVENILIRSSQNICISVLYPLSQYWKDDMKDKANNDTEKIQFGRVHGNFLNLLLEPDHIRVQIAVCWA